MQFVEINLEEVCSAQPKLSEEKIKEYLRKGIDWVTKQMQIKPPPVQTYRWNEQKITELVDGFHRCRALYDKGIRNISATYEGEKESTDKPPIKLKDAQVLNKKEYRIWAITQQTNPK